MNDVITHKNIADIITEEYVNCVMRNLQYLKQKKNDANIRQVKDGDGKTHYEVIVEEVQTVNSAYRTKNKIKIIIPSEYNELIHSYTEYKSYQLAVCDMYNSHDTKSVMEQFYKDYKGKKVPEVAKLYLDNNEERKKRIIREAEKKVILDMFVGPTLANYFLGKFFKAEEGKTIKDGVIHSEKDKGYCTKSITIAFYWLKRKYGNFDWLPTNADDASNPSVLIKYIEENFPDCVKESNDVSEEIKTNNYAVGTLVFVENTDKEGMYYHAMMYNGKDTDGEPTFAGFNFETEHWKFLHKRKGKIVDISRVIQTDFEHCPMPELPDTRTVKGTFFDKEYVSNSEKARYHFAADISRNFEIIKIKER